jgi:hypothetical protein
MKMIIEGATEHKAFTSKDSKEEIMDLPDSREEFK